MKKHNLMALILAVLMIIAIPAAVTLATGPTQPPVVTNTLYVGTIGWGPKDPDPAVAYDTGSGELIFNSYETLIAMGEPVTNDFADWDVKEQYWEFSPLLATNVPDRVEVLKDFVNLTPFDPANPVGTILQTVPPTSDREYHICGWNNNNSTDLVVGPCDILYIMELDAISGEPITCRTWHVKGLEITGPTNVILHLHYFYYDFNIRETPTVNFVDNTTAIVDVFDIYDVEYSFERSLATDPQSSTVQWMLYMATLDQKAGSSWWDTGDVNDVICLSYLIDDAFEIISVDPPIFRINVGIDFPDAAFKQIIAQTWGSILSREYSISIGDWDGELHTLDGLGWPLWWTTTRYVEPTPYTAGWIYVGTGPYLVNTVSAVNSLVILQRNPHYWGGWPGPHNADYLEYVDIEYISDWATRRDAFKACQLDVCAVPRAYMDELLDPDDTAKMTTIPPEIKTIKNIYPGLSLDATHYTFAILPSSPYIGTGNLASGLGIPVNFFNYTDVRYAFSYAFNRSQYLAEAWKGEASLRETPLISGLVPDYYTQAPDPPYKFDINYAEAKAHLMAAIMNSTGGQSGTLDSVWNWGFSLTITYNTGNDQRKIACNMIRDFFANMSTDPTRAGKPAFQMTVLEVDWPTYLTNSYQRRNAIWAIGWLSDYADADNWEGAYMHSFVCFASWQRWREALGWTTKGSRTGLTKDQLIELAIKTPDGPDRAKMYADLDEIYLADCASLPTAEPLGRRWCKYWVKGWYYDGLYPSQYYYGMYKMDTCWADVFGGANTGDPDGICNMKDIGYIAQHFGARAPDPTATGAEYDARWAPGKYGAGGADVYGDRRVDMRDIGFACAHFLHEDEP